MPRTALASACLTLLTSLCLHAPSQAQQGASALAPRVGELVGGMYGQLDTLYKDLHANPELGFQEVRTAAKLAAEMRAIGFEVTEKIGKTGLPYASKAKATALGRETFVAHSCGHDIHMASWVGTARTLMALKDQWHGTLMFVAQPAEELVSGADAMLADGLFTRFGKPDFAFALHTSPQPYGTVGYNVGAVTSNSDALEITFKGRGGHGSAPDKALDPIVIAAKFITDVQTVVSREKDPFEFGVVTVGAVQAGSVGNIIPDQAVLRGTIRSYKPEVRAKLLDGVRRTARAAALMAGAPEPEVTLQQGGLAVVNAESVVSTTEAVLKDTLGAKNVFRVPPITASEDFSAFVNQGVPAMFFFVGVSEPQQFMDSLKPGGKPLPFNHSPQFAPVPEPSIKTGVRAMSMAVLNVMARK